MIDPEPVTALAEIGRPSAFFAACRESIRESARVGRGLDLACGRGRHSLAAAALGLDVLALDRNPESLATLRRAALARSDSGDPRAGGATTPPGRIETREVDLEGAAPPALEPGSFGCVLVFRYLHRPLCPWIEGLLAPGGVLVYETFTTAQRSLGWGPSRDAFLLEAGELPTLFPGLECERFEEGPSGEPRAAETARMLARKPAA